MSKNGSTDTIEGVIIAMETVTPDLYTTDYSTMTSNATNFSPSFNATAITLCDVQWGNLVISSLSGILIHVYIAFSVLKKRLLNDKYMLLTYMRSYIDIIYLMTTLYIQEVYHIVPGASYPDTEVSSQFGEASPGLQNLLGNIKRLAQQLQMLLLMMMIVHRFLVFTRPGAIPTAYAVFFLICIVFCSVAGVFFDPTKRALDCLYMVLTTIMVIMAAVIHSSLRNYFTAHKYSTNVCEMQGKTSKFLLYCILIYSICYVLFPLISIFCSGIIASLVTSDPKEKTISAASISFIIARSLIPWLPLADGILTLWSVRGYLSAEEPNIHTRISVVQNSNESQC